MLPDTLPAPSSAPSASPAEFRLEEFRQLRATIRERGATRVVVSLITFVSWAALALAFRHAHESMVYGLLPLVVLVAGFELVFALHVGVERIGRYLTAFYEASPGMPKWETAIAAFGRSAGGGRAQPHVLLAIEFTVATGLNLLFLFLAFLAAQPDTSALTQGSAIAVLHAVFIARIVQAVRQAGRQRDADGAAFGAIAKDIST
jgi:hypothetical protein